MKLLLDTHTFLWFIAGNPAISARALQLIQEPANQRFLSTASLWEMAIKASLGKLEIATSFEELVASQVEANAIQLLEIAPRHLEVLRRLPFLHRDPFDRLIIAQSLSDQMPVLGRDDVFEDYGVERIWKG